MVEYDEIVADPAKLRPLFDFLGAPFDIEGLRALMKQPHSYKPEKGRHSRRSMLRAALWRVGRRLERKYRLYEE